MPITHAANERGESMLELCPIRSSTEKPCPRLADSEQQGRGGRKLCKVHAALKPLEEEVDDLSLAEALLEGWIEEAGRFDNAPLLLALRHAKEEMHDRFEVLEEIAKAISTAH